MPYRRGMTGPPGASQQETPPSHALAQQLVWRDVGFLIGLLSTLVEREAAGDEGATWLVLTYLDWASLTTYEIRDLHRKGIAIPGADSPMQYEREVADSRHSTKLLDDTKKTIEDQLHLFRDYSAAHRDQLIGMTRAPGLIRAIPWLGRLQADTGVVLCGEEVLATTVSLRHHLGLEMNSDPGKVHGRGEELGAFLGGALGEEGANWAARTIAANMAFPPAHAKDALYTEFFQSTFMGVPVPESMVLSTISCRLRAALLMGAVARQASAATALLSFKFRFAVTWQVASTLRTILDNETTFELAPKFVQELRDVQDEESVAAMAGQGLRRLRNVLVHYALHDRDTSLIDWTDPLLGLPQAFCAGKTWVDIDALIESAGRMLIQMLDDWRGPVGHLLREPD
jgi:hypothetical protein